MKHIRASSGPRRIFRFINITEFPSTRTLQDHSFSFYRLNLPQEMAIFYFHWKGSITATDLSLSSVYYGIYSYTDVLYLEPTEKMLIVEISLVSQYNTFLLWILRDIIYYTFNTIYWQNIFSKTNVCICFTNFISMFTKQTFETV